MLRRCTILVAGVLAVAGLPAADGADDPIAQRKALMKSVGAAAKTIGGMMETGFDGAKAAEAANAIAAAATDFPSHFPVGSEKGGRTKASPRIWRDMERFKAASLALATDALATATAAGAGEGEFKVAAEKLFANCRGCHAWARVQK